MKLHHEDFPDIVENIDKLSEKNNYTKIFVKIPAEFEKKFEKFGYQREACIPKFFNGRKDAVFMGKYFSEHRKNDKNLEIIKTNLKLAEEKRKTPASSDIPEGFEFSKLSSDSVDEAAQLYKDIFTKYPFPIFDPVYLHNTMESHVDYFCVRDKGKMIALASAEKDEEHQNVEMTDFATIPEYRGRGLASALLKKMEEEMKDQGMKTAYTIARALSAGMNITFARAGYEFAGTLINNTNIYSGLESMNVWYKPLK